MGVAERKERHKEELKKDILTAAKELYLENGFEATSIRNIAEKIEYSPATVYLYYKDKDEIMHALHQEGFKMLIEYFIPISNIPNPFERLKALGQAYIRFSIDHAEMYKLIFVMKEPMDHVENCPDEEWNEGEGAFDMLHNTVKQCQEAGYFAGLDSQGLSFMIWSTMHGLCTLYGSGHLAHVCSAKAINLDIDDVMNFTFGTFVKTLESLKK
jgi:AcrR family transcriptional regulator